ncbi:ATP-dependent DNA helicase, RecQ family [Ancylostoma caninum]|uniref:DNA 3'-5' helicase n=1 Tax=Ancylostoma caninum TaxID=29170 RepID=A0A368GYQ0_ANCCA|nr:ATP-dependent DNA helicase, RecQ family [Ancylostoma caninum]
MQAAKQRYDAVKPRERVDFCGYRFVIPSANFEVPKFRCCNGAHEGVTQNRRSDSFDLTECANQVQDIIRTTSTSDAPPVQNGASEASRSVQGPQKTPSDAQGPQKALGKGDSFSEFPTSHSSPYVGGCATASVAADRSVAAPLLSKSTSSAASLNAKNNEKVAPAIPPALCKPSTSNGQVISDVVEDSDEEILFQDEPSDDCILLDGEPAAQDHDSFDELEYMDTQPPPQNVYDLDSDDSFNDEIVPTQRNTNAFSSTSGERHDMHGQFRGFLKDDGDEFEDEVAALGQELRDKMYSTLKEKFGFNSFRHRQKTAITAILLGHDAFVLMPTGWFWLFLGCYEYPYCLNAIYCYCRCRKKFMLPAASNFVRRCDGSRFTIEVAYRGPALKDERPCGNSYPFKIPCEALMGDEDQEQIYSRLMCSPPGIKLLYVTPEKISASGRLASVFTSLHKRNFLARFVIDEAHCVSQWGHDFRPDYTKLQSLRREYAYPKVPIVALTATATPKIVADTKDHLGIADSKLFISSFVRNNLTYEIIPKAAKSFSNVVEKMKQLYPGKAGIVYCLSRKECESVSTVLNKAGVYAEVYHAGLPDKQRVQIQHRWLRNTVNVICATIAFGMGIDKPDVRFVIHYSLPKSIEGYYQETGRAGRDGHPSYCLLLYSYQDSIRLRKMIEDMNNLSFPPVPPRLRVPLCMGNALNAAADDSQAPASVRSMHLQNIYQMVSYCENISTCRRKILVEHFGEVYDAQMCLKSTTPCDVCQRLRQNPDGVKLFDVSEEALMILTALNRMRNVTLRYLAELFRGQLNKKDADQAMRLGHTALPFYGRGVGMSEQDSLRFLRKMVAEGYIEERLYRTKFESTVAYAELSAKGRQMAMSGSKPKVYLHVATDKKRKSIASDLLARTAVSEAKALKEKHVVKYGDIFTRCLQALTELLTDIAEEGRLSGPYAIISREGLEQVAALLPRTNSDLVQVDSMTSTKVERYGARIMTALKPFWKEVDDRDEAEMRKQLEKLKEKEPAAPLPPVPSQPAGALGPSTSAAGKFAPRFGRYTRGRGAANAFRGAKATPRLKRKTSSRGNSQASSGGTRAKRPRPSFKPPTGATRGRGAKVGRGTSQLNPMLFPV